MFIKVLNKRQILMAGWFSDFVIDRNQLEEYKKMRGLYIENPWERVKCLFKKNDKGNLHPEMIKAINMAQTGVCAGAVLGGIIYSIKYSSDFLRDNDATLFSSHREAHKKLIDQSIIGFGKGAFKVAPFFAVFLGGYSLLTSCAEAYRNKSGIVEHAIAGIGIGALLRFHYGVRGMIVFGILGGALGVIYGSVMLAVLSLTGYDSLEFQFIQYTLPTYMDQAKVKDGRQNTAMEAAEVGEDMLEYIQVEETPEVREETSEIKKSNTVKGETGRE